MRLYYVASEFTSYFFLKININHVRVGIHFLLSKMFSKSADHLSNFRLFSYFNETSAWVNISFMNQLMILLFTEKILYIIFISLFSYQNQKIFCRQAWRIYLCSRSNENTGFINFVHSLISFFRYVYFLFYNIIFFYERFTHNKLGNNVWVQVFSVFKFLLSFIPSLYFASSTFVLVGRLEFSKIKI